MDDMEKGSTQDTEERVITPPFCGAGIHDKQGENMAFLQAFSFQFIPISFTFLEIEITLKTRAEN